MSNTRFWDKLGKTDPSATKAFTRAGGFKGTAIKPMWAFKRMTEEFGPCGLGWGVNEPAFQVVPGADGEVLVYCTVSIWYGEGSGDDERNCFHAPVYGVGGDKVVTKDRNGLRSDDEAFKKSYTDAVTNALKLIGVGADVHMGLFDDNKYVNDMRAEFAEEKQEPPPPKPKETKYPLQEGERRQLWERMMNDLKGEGPKGADAMVRYMQSKETQEDLAKLEPWRQNFRKEAAELVEATRAAEGIAGEKGATIKRIKAPDFSALAPNDLDPIEQLAGRHE